MLIRVATPDDSGSIAPIAVAAWQWAYQSFMADDVLKSLDVNAGAERQRQRLQDGSVVFVAVIEGADAGFAAVEEPARLLGSDLEIGGLYVERSCARKGVGRALVGFVAAWGLAQGRSRMSIHTLRENRIGRSFYERLGGRAALEDVWSFRGTDYPAVWYLYSDLKFSAQFAP